MVPGFRVFPCKSLAAVILGPGMVQHLAEYAQLVPLFCHEAVRLRCKPPQALWTFLTNPVDLVPE